VKIRGRRFILTTIPNNSAYLLLGSVYEKTSNGSWIKIKLESQASAWTRGLGLDITGRRIKVWDRLPPLTSLRNFQPCNSTVSLTICAQQRRRTQKQEACLWQLCPFDRNDTAMHNVTFCAPASYRFRQSCVALNFYNQIWVKIYMHIYIQFIYDIQLEQAI